MTETFKWAKAHTPQQPDRRTLKKERYNIFHLPECNAVKPSGALYNGIVYYYERKVLSVEILWWSPYEWLDTVAMRKETGERLRALLNGGKYLYYIQQPVGVRGGKKENRLQPYTFFQQFVIRSEEPPAEETLKEVFNIITNSPIEGEECGDYKNNRYDQGATPLSRTTKRLAFHRKKRARQEEDFSL